MDEMDAPVTLRQLREELRQFVTRTELQTELETFGEKLEARLEARLEAKFDAKLEKIRREIVLDIGEEMARQIRAGQEETRAWLRTLDDQYRDLPKRVTTIEASELPSRVEKLEAAVFAPPPRKRRRKAS